jgi:hypothetical protein
VNAALLALKAAHAAGIRIDVDGDNLTLDADAEPPAEILARLKAHKRGVIDLLLLRSAKPEPAWLTALLARPRPTSDTPSRWRRRCDGLRRFVNAGWDKRAADLGWSWEDLFAIGTGKVHGAAWFLEDDRVLFLTDNQIMACSETGFAQPIYRGVSYA